MTDREDIVAAVIEAAGGALTSRVRLQKVVYLLDQLGLESGFDYDYHHYGPYSRELDNATADAQAFGLVEEKFDHRVSDGARYSIFALRPQVRAKDEAFGRLGREKAAELVRGFTKTNVTVLELAATINWLSREEQVDDWRAEVTKRKSVKVENGRLERAVELLESLGLAPPPVRQAA